MIPRDWLLPGGCQGEYLGVPPRTSSPGRHYRDSADEPTALAAPKLTVREKLSGSKELHANFTLTSSHRGPRWRQRKYVAGIRPPARHLVLVYVVST